MTNLFFKHSYFSFLALSVFLGALATGCQNKGLYTGAPPVTKDQPPAGPPGTLDTSFGVQGKMLSSIGVSATASASALTKDGRIYLGGTVLSSRGDLDFYVTRLLSNGQVDTTFNGTGTVTTDVHSSITAGHGQDTVNALAVQTEVDGTEKLIAAGQTLDVPSGKWLGSVVRYNPDGSLDTSFASNGFITMSYGSNTDYYSTLAIQNDNKIVLGGHSDPIPNVRMGAMVTTRFDVNGSADSAFANSAVIPFPSSAFVSSVAVHSDAANLGKIVSAGTVIVVDASGVTTNKQFVVTRYKVGNPAILDTGFGPHGSGILVGSDFAINNSAANWESILSDGKILVAGTYNASTPLDHAFIVKLNADGKTLDSTFGNAGKVFLDLGLGQTDRINSLSVQNDGKIVAVGSTFTTDSNNSKTSVGRAFIARYLPSGQLDTSFSSTGFQIFAFGPHDHTIVNLLYGNRIIFGGWTHTYLSAVPTDLTFTSNQFLAALFQ